MMDSASFSQRFSAASIDSLKQAQDEILRFLASSVEVAHALSKFGQGDLYRVVLDGGKLYQVADGLYKGIIKGMDGKIIGNAKFTKVGPNVLAASASIMLHFVLHEICHKLGKIQGDINLIQALLKNGLDTKAQGAIMMFRHVKTSSEAQFKAASLANSATELYSSILALIERLKLEIDSVPAPENGFFDDILWRESKAKATIASLKVAEMTPALIIECIRTLGEIHFVVGNNAAGVNAVEELFIRTLEAGIDEAAWKARRILPSLPLTHISLG